MAAGSRGLAMGPRTRAYVGGVVALGTLAAFASVTFLPRAAPAEDAVVLLAGSALLMSAMFFLQTRSLTLPWKGQRIAIHPDEGVLLVGVYFLPPAAVVFVALAATLASQAHLRKPPLKMAFNAAAVTLSAAVAALCVGLLVAAGLPRFAAVVCVPLALAGVNQAVVGALLTIQAGQPVRATFRRELWKSVAMAGVTGVVLGYLTVGLTLVHPALVAVPALLALVAHQAMAVEFRHEAEMAARRALNRASERLVGVDSDDAIVEAVFGACAEALLLRDFSVSYAPGGGAARAWSMSSGATPGGRVALVRRPILDPAGAVVGELALTVSSRSRVRLREDEELASLMASYLSIAFGSARAARATREAEARLRRAFDACGEAMLLLDAEGRVRHANEPARAAFGALAEPGSLLDLPGPEGGLPAWIAARPRERAEYAADVRAPSGEARRHELRVEPFDLDPGAPGVLVAARDVTERERQREALERHERLVGLGTLVAGIAHEINNPLVYVEGNLALLEEDLARASAGGEGVDLQEALASVRTAIRGAERIAHITRNLRVSPRARQSPKPVRVNRLVEEVADLLRSSAPPGVAVACDPCPEDLVVMGDPVDLHQAVMTLARNAVEAVAEEGGVVTLSARRRDGAAEVAVADTGRGVPPDAMPRLFTPFFSTKPEGTGLGLSMVHGIAQAHGGDATVESEPGRGATFRIRVPAAAP